MEHKSLLDQLLELPKDATKAEIQGIEMQFINEEQRASLLQTDPQDTSIHECSLVNGTFIFIMRDGTLVSLYKVKLGILKH